MQRTRFTGFCLPLERFSRGANLTAFAWKAGSRAGSVVGIHYDPMLAKIIAHAPTREGAIRKLRHALEVTLVQGVITNREFLIAALDHPEFIAGRIHTESVIPFEPDRRGETSAKAALDAYLITRHTKTRRVLPSVAPGYRNNPFHVPAQAAEVIAIEAGRVRVEIDARSMPSISHRTTASIGSAPSRSLAFRGILHPRAPLPPKPPVRRCRARCCEF